MCRLGGQPSSGPLVQASNLRVELARLIKVIGEEAQDDGNRRSRRLSWWSDGMSWWLNLEMFGTICSRIFLGHVFFGWLGVLFFFSCESHLQHAPSPRVQPTATPPNLEKKQCEQITGGKSTTGQLLWLINPPTPNVPPSEIRVQIRPY